MNIHEYQGKEILRQYGVATPRGYPCFSVDEAVAAAERLGGKVWVVKAQIHAGGRGKGGGVKVAKSLDEVRRACRRDPRHDAVTHQTGPEGRVVKRLLIEEGADIRKELYVGMVVDRGTQRVTLMASSEGGMDIEEVAAHTPGEDSQGVHRPGHRADRRPGRRRRTQDRHARGLAGPGARIHAGPVPRVRRMRRVAGRDQPADPDRRRPRARARCEVQFRFERAVPPSGDRRACATSTRRIRPRSRPRSSISPTSRSTATSAAWSTAPASRWRRWTSSSCTAARRRTSSTSAAARRRRR